MANPVAAVHTEVRDLASDDPADVVARALLVWCPGCAELGHTGTHRLPFEAGPAFAGGPVWGWNGDLVKPTLHPSVLTRWTDQRGDQVCHSFIVEGTWQYLTDCTHQLAGQTVPLPPLPDWLVN